MAESSGQILGEMKAINAALLSGDYPSMAAMTEHLERALAGKLEGLNKTGLMQLRAQAQTNAVLLQSAQRGLRAAQRRIAEIRGVAAGLSTYSAKGQRTYSAQRAGQDHRS